MNHLRALALSPVIFSKPGKVLGICQTSCNAYYKHLIVAGNLQAVAALDDDVLANMSEKDFVNFLRGHVPAPKAAPKGAAKALAKGAGKAGMHDDGAGGAAGAPPPPGDAAGAPPLPLPDGDGEGDPIIFEDPDDVDLPHAPHHVAPAPVVAPTAAVHVLMPELPPPDPPVLWGLGGFDNFQVNFDRHTHQSGRPRAFLYCTRHEGRCRRYVFTDDYASKEAACAWLFAWRLLADHGGLALADATAAEHIAANPPADLVEASFEMRFGFVG